MRRKNQPAEAKLCCCCCCCCSRDGCVGQTALARAARGHVRHSRCGRRLPALERVVVGRESREVRADARRERETLSRWPALYLALPRRTSRGPSRPAPSRPRPSPSAPPLSAARAAPPPAFAPTERQCAPMRPCPTVCLWPALVQQAAERFRGCLERTARLPPRTMQQRHAGRHALDVVRKHGRAAAALIYGEKQTLVPDSPDSEDPRLGFDRALSWLIGRGAALLFALFAPLLCWSARLGSFRIGSTKPRHRATARVSVSFSRCVLSSAHRYLAARLRSSFSLFPFFFFRSRTFYYAFYASAG